MLSSISSSSLAYLSPPLEYVYLWNFNFRSLRPEVLFCNDCRNTVTDDSLYYINLVTFDLLRTSASCYSRIVIDGKELFKGKRAWGRSPMRWSDQVKKAASSSKFY